MIAPGRQGARDAPPPPSGAPASATILRAGTQLLAPQAPERSTGPALKIPAMTPEDRDRAMRLLRKGDEHLSEGNISAARLFYERAADVGVAEAAMALAGTYDTSELSRLHARGITPNAAEARRWYERARESARGGADRSAASAPTDVVPALRGSIRRRRLTRKVSKRDAITRRPS